MSTDVTESEKFSDESEEFDAVINDESQELTEQNSSDQAPRDSEDNEDIIGQNEQFAYEFMRQTLSLHVCRIDRESFLRSELQSRRYSPEQIQEAIDTTPLEAGIAFTDIDDIAKHAIDFETPQAAALAFVTGLPGGLAMLVTIPADILQNYIYSLRIMQKIAYAYGWQSFTNDMGESNDETIAKLLAFFGISLGVEGTGNVILALAKGAGQQLQKKLVRTALTKTTWYPILKKIAQVFGYTLTKKAAGNVAAKAVPVLGGAISATITLGTLKIQSEDLRKFLRTIPPTHVNAAEFAKLLDEANKSEKADVVYDVAKGAEEFTNQAGKAVVDTATAIGNAAGNAANAIANSPAAQAVANSPVGEAAGNVANEAGKMFGFVGNVAGDAIHNVSQAVADATKKKD